MVGGTFLFVRAERNREALWSVAVTRACLRIHLSAEHAKKVKRGRIARRESEAGQHDKKHYLAKTVDASNRKQHDEDQRGCRRPDGRRSAVTHLVAAPAAEQDQARDEQENPECEIARKVHVVDLTR